MGTGKKELVYVQCLADTLLATVRQAEQICIPASEKEMYLSFVNATSRRYAIEDWKTPVEEAFVRAAALRCLVFSDYVENSSANIQSVAYAAHLISNISMTYCIKPSTLIKKAGIEYFDDLYQLERKFDEKQIDRDTADFAKRFALRKGRYEGASDHPFMQSIEWMMELTPNEDLHELLDNLLEKW